MSHRHAYANWPFLTTDEYNLACALFDKRYISACLGSTRRTFKINQRSDLSTGVAYIEILRALHIEHDAGDLSEHLERLTAADAGAAAKRYPEDQMEEDDPEALQSVPGAGHDDLPGYRVQAEQPYVKYEIHLHSTYRVPTLWFTMHDLPMGEPGFNIDSVYRYLVPDGYKDRLRAVGMLGGISAAPHPLTNVPAFFIHPCQTKEAMEIMDCTIDEYLMVWLGLVGGSVGLWIPVEMGRVEM